jgi:hypothetical protein
MTSKPIALILALVLAAPLVAEAQRTGKVPLNSIRIVAASDTS